MRRKENNSRTSRKIGENRVLVRKKNERSLILVSVSLTKIEIREEKKKI